MSELEEGLLAGQLDEQDEKEKAESGMSLSVAQPLVREWLAKRRANLRPVGTFFNTANFQVSLMMWRNCYLDFCYSAYPCIIKYQQYVCEEEEKLQLFLLTHKNINKVPPSAGRLSKRLIKNIDYFQV